MAVQLDTSSGRLLNRRSNHKRDSRGRYISDEKSFAWLLDYPVVRDWIDAYTVEETREKKLYQLEKIIGAFQVKEPRQLLEFGDREIKTLIRRFANSYLQQGKAVWARQVIMTMKGFLEANERRLEFRQSERIRSPARKKISIEYIPNRKEIYRMADNAGSARNRAVILCLFQSGVRVSCLCHWTIDIFQDQLYPQIRPPIRIKISPAMDTKLSLYNLSYYVTGLQEEAAESLREYIDSRRRNGWLPKSGDPLFVTERGGGPANRLRREGVWTIVKNVARRSGLRPETVWVHCIRKSFRKVLNATPTIDEDTKEALMGHKLPGSRGNYFDYHDEDEVMAKYMRADFHRPTVDLEAQTSNHNN